MDSLMDSNPQFKWAITLIMVNSGVILITIDHNKFICVFQESNLKIC